MRKEQPLSLEQSRIIEQQPTRFLASLVRLADVWLPRAVLLGSAGVLLMSLAAGLSPVPDMFAPLLSHFAGALFAALTAMFLGRARLSVLLLGLMTTLFAHAALGWWRQDTATLTMGPSHAREPGLARIVAINAWHNNPDIERLHQYLTRETATWAVLTEVGPNRMALLERLKPVYPHQVSCADTWYCSAALLSKVPFEASGRIEASGVRPPIVWARFRLAGQAQPVTIVGTHIHRPTRNPWRHRVQLEALASTLKRVEGAIIVAGDFNTSIGAGSLEEFMSATGLSSSGCWLPSWPVWPLNLPQVALDHVLVTSELAIAASGLGPAVGSDHLPVWAEFRTDGVKSRVRCGR